jgi:glycosyltransferase involved in cell wall biosynthesis
MIDTSFKPGHAKRVLHLVGRMKPGGVENWLMRLLRKADRNILQMDFCVATPQKGLYEEEIESLGSKIIRIPIKPFLTYQHRLARILRENEYDVVHSHGWLFSGIVMKVAHRCRVPIRIAHGHTTSTEHSPTMYRKLYTYTTKRLIMRHSTHLIGCCKASAAALYGPDWQDDNRCSLVYYCFDDEDFRPGQTCLVKKEDFGLPSDAIVVGHVGSFRMAKNHTFLLNVAAEIFRRQPKAYLFLAGDGALRKDVEAKAKNLGISDRVVFAGVRKDVPQLLMHLLDVLVFPSIYEGLPLTLFEAAVTGLRVVCSDVITREVSEPLPEAFTYLSLNLSPKQWAEKVIEVLSQGKIAQEYAYQKYMNSHFSVEHCLRELYVHYACQGRLENLEQGTMNSG